MKSIFQEKWALVTGGSEGIGFAIAQELLDSGANVAILSRSTQKQEKACGILSVHVKPGKQLIAIPCDLTDYERVKTVLEDFCAAHACPDFVFQCAGYARPGFIETLEIDHFHGMMDINYFGIVNVTKVLLPAMMARKSGYFVNTASMAAYIGLFGFTAYCASKYAVLGFSKALASELEPYNIQVSVLCPPATRTPGFEEENRQKPAEVLATEEKVQVVDPSFVAAATLKAMRRRKFKIIPTFDGRLAWWIGRLSPSLLRAIVRRPAIKYP